MTKFSDLNLSPKVLKAIQDTGYETPTPIQAGAIPPALEGRDVLGIAQTGTGKTASFVLPMLTMLAKGRARARMPRSLVLAPTRELAAQVAENFDTYSKHLKLTKALLIGGVSFKEQDALIDRGVDVLIATPGRLLDHFSRGKLLLTGVQIMVVDEADRMLDMGFIPDIERIFNLTPFTRQTLFFSATMAPEIERITNTFLSNPERIEVARQATTGENIKQTVVMFKASRKDRAATEKRRLLRAIIDDEGDKLSNGIIFCNRKVDVDIVAKSLTKYGYDAAPIHGDLDQSQRTRTLDGFRNGDLKILVASDVAARGLDVPSVSHVFNFDVPGHAEDYVHRIGRTGRAGRDGKAMMICEPRDEKNLTAIEDLVKKEIPRGDNPVKTVKRSRRTDAGKTDVTAAAPAVAAPVDNKAESAADTKVEAVAEVAAATPDAPRTSDKPKRTRVSRSRSRGGDNKADSSARNATGRDAANRNEAAEAAPVADATPAPAQLREDRAPRQNARDTKRDGQRDNNRDNNRDQGRDQGRDQNKRGGYQGNRRGGGNNVVGMGDHLPSFIALSFDERRDAS
jgi:superfamily II DNA/RNA helicase